MKKKYYVIINWKVKSPAGVYRMSSKVVECMKGNKNFLTPAVPMEDFEAASTRLNAAIDNRENGPAARTELEEAAVDMDTKMREQAAYVSEESKGEKKIIESSGFQPNKGEETKAIVPDVPKEMAVTSRNGTIVLSAKKPKGATSLCWVIFVNREPAEVAVTSVGVSLPADAGNTFIIPAGKAREVLDIFPIGTKITAQVLAQNAAGKSPLTVPRSAVVNL